MHGTAPTDSARSGTFSSIAARPRVVILGAGFGGLNAAQALKNAPVDVTLIDQRNYHLFQPLLYQVATAGLSPAQIATPIRFILAKQKNATVLMDRVLDIDRTRKLVITQSREVPFDYLVVATGARHAYFGHDEWEKHAPGLKKIDDAIAIRTRVLTAFERAEVTMDETERRRLLTFGISVDMVPLGFINGQGENDGYEFELTQMIAKDLGVEPKYVPLSIPARIPSLITRKVDLVLCGLGMYPDRAKTIQFAKPILANDMVVYGKTEDNIKQLSDLSGRSISVPRTSAMDTEITKAAIPDLDIKRFDDDAATVQALVSGQTDTTGGYRAYFYSIDRAAPGKFDAKVVLGTEYVGIGIRPGQKELTDWINDFLDRHEKDGSLNALYKKWFGVDMPTMPASMEGVPYTVQ